MKLNDPDTCRIDQSFYSPDQEWISFDVWNDLAISAVRQDKVVFKKSACVGMPLEFANSAIFFAGSIQEL